MNEKSDDQMQKMFEDAARHNSLLYQTQTAGIRLDASRYCPMKSHESMLNFGDGLIGSIEIPKISLKYPLYHGTQDKILNQGIGHLRKSSLPADETGEHMVLSGHRGLPTAKLFTRLDEMDKGDLFFLNVGDQKMAYRVNDICAVERNDTRVMKIEPDKDLVSLVTCTPYDINLMAASDWKKAN